MFPPMLQGHVRSANWFSGRINNAHAQNRAPFELKSEIARLAWINVRALRREPISHHRERKPASLQIAHTESAIGTSHCRRLLRVSPPCHGHLRSGNWLVLLIRDDATDRQPRSQRQNGRSLVKLRNRDAVAIRIAVRLHGEPRVRKTGMFDRYTEIAVARWHIGALPPAGGIGFRYRQL